MRNATYDELERIAGQAGWDGFTLLLLVCRWAEQKDLSRSLIEHLAGIARTEDDGHAEV